MRIWIFGDSFAEIRDGVDHQWQVIISKYFDCEILNVASNGASSEWLTLKISEHWNKLEKNDIVIFFVPYWDRQCFFPDDPDLTHILTLDGYDKDEAITNKWNRYTKLQRQAFRDYFLHLHDENLVKLKTKSLYSWINNIHTKTKKLPLVIDTRHNNFVVPDGYYNKAIGTLFDVSVNEWKNKKTWEDITKNGLFDDNRISHLTPNNHKILADKIIDFIENDITVDLTTQFRQSFFNNEQILYQSKTNKKVKITSIEEF